MRPVDAHNNTSSTQKLILNLQTAIILQKSRCCSWLMHCCVDKTVCVYVVYLSYSMRGVYVYAKV